MRLSAAVVCCNFADIAAITLPLNRSHFDDLLVVTGPEDRDTQQLCRELGVKLIVSHHLHRYSGIAKAHAINLALFHLERRARHRRLSDWRGLRDWWFLQLDSDIVLPARTRPILDHVGLVRRTLYGIDREGMRPHVWARRGVPHSDGNLVSYAPRGVWRVGHDDGDGELLWWPLGYFQLWCPQGSGVRRYPTALGREGLPNRTTDRELAALFPRRRRADVPELIAAHLLPDDARPGADWQGRVTQPFTIPPEGAYSLTSRH